MGGLLSHHRDPTVPTQRANTIRPPTQPPTARSTTIAPSIPTPTMSYTAPAPHPIVADHIVHLPLFRRSSYHPEDPIEDVLSSLTQSSAQEAARSTTIAPSTPRSPMSCAAPTHVAWNPISQSPQKDAPIEDVFSSLSLTSNETGVPIYTLMVSKSRVSFFVPSGKHFIEKTRSEISIVAIEENKIYLVDSINGKGQVTGLYSSPSADLLKKYTERNSFVCENTDAYREVILPGLLLGCRVRDFEQRCASVDRMDELVLNMPSLPIKNLKKLKLKTVGGHFFSIGVKGVQKTDADRRWIVTCEEPTVPLPSGLRRGDLLEIMGIYQQEPRVTDALMHFYKKASVATEALLRLARIYGEPSHLVLPPVSTVHPMIPYANNGGAVPLNPEQKEAIARYNSPTCPAFAIEAPPGSGKTLTAAAMAVSYEGKGIQLFLSTANVPVSNMALQLAKLDYSSRAPIHLMSAESEEKETEETRSPFSSLSLAKTQEHLRVKIEALEQQIPYAPNFEEKDKIKKEIRTVSSAVLDQPHDIYFATVDTILGRYFKSNQGGKHNKDPVKKQLTTSVERIVVDEASQLTEAALNALILCFPKAQIVLIGDSKQLPPFKLEAGEIVSELAARPALDVIKDKVNLPVIRLRRVYRASASLIAHYSNVFYDSNLMSNRNEVKNPLAFFGKRGGSNRCLFWKVKNGVSFTPPGSTSKLNMRELVALKYLVGMLGYNGITEKDVMIISYYEAQRKRAEEFVPKGYEILTVDSAQGREKRIVIVLTTRSSVPTDPESFFLNSKRCNVAMSRHKEALIVIGHPSISVAPNWTQVLSPKYFHHVEDDNGRTGSN